MRSQCAALCCVLNLGAVLWAFFLSELVLRYHTIPYHALCPGCVKRSRQRISVCYFVLLWEFCTTFRSQGGAEEAIQRN